MWPLCPFIVEKKENIQKIFLRFVISKRFIEWFKLFDCNCILVYFQYMQMEAESGNFMAIGTAVVFDEGKYFCTL